MYLPTSSRSRQLSGAKGTTFTRVVITTAMKRNMVSTVAMKVTVLTSGCCRMSLII